MSIPSLRTGDHPIEVVNYKQWVNTTQLESAEGPQIVLRRCGFASLRLHLQSDPGS
jgi:hypothetical protein